MMSTTETNFTISNVVKVFPKRVYEKDNRKAALLFAKSLFFCVVSTAILYVVPWYAVPAAWVASGLALTSLHVIGHDCAHGNFFSNPSLNWLVGCIAFGPVFYPFSGWKVQHDDHHNSPAKHRQSLEAQSSKSFWRLINPIYWPIDILEMFFHYYDLSKFDEASRHKARLSVFVSYLTAALFFPFMVRYFGVSGLIKLWFAPWVVFHFWKNSLRQALPAVSLSYPHPQKSLKYKALSTPVEDEALRRELLNEMVHYDFPWVFEFVCHDVNFQIPHYLDRRIPVYHLREAQKALMASRWADKVKCYRFGWGLLRAARTALETRRTVSVDEIYRGNTTEQLRAQLGEYNVAPEGEAKAVLASQLYQVLKEHDSLPVAPEKKPVSTAPAATVFPAKPNLMHISLFLFTHTAALYGLLFVPYNSKTFIWSVIWYFATGLGITAGYHRLWAHRGYEAALPVRLLLMFCGSGAVEGCIKWWATGHRIHHRYTDTDDDPYNSRRGFWYAHMGWMLWKEDKGRPQPKVPIEDLLSDPLVAIQHKFYPFFAFFWSFIFPTLVAMLWGDIWGGYFWAGAIRLCFVHHATFCVNSLAHFAGSQPFADRHTPRDSFITAFVTLGEGYHNFHHEFPKDYRNAIRWWQYDPTKWLIRTLAFFGLTYNLKVFPENEIKKGQLQMMEKKLHSTFNSVDWGTDVEELPLYTWEEFSNRHKTTNDRWIVVGGIIHDVSEWADDHPGGKRLIEAFVGKDATKAFNGGVYNHSNAGRNLLAALRVGRIEHENEHGEALPDDQYQIEFAVGDSNKTALKKRS
jgi:stearoyl-CoA desaturase (delta-9 desaturase)